MKSILTLGAAITALALVFAGCDNAYEVTNTDTIPTLSGPGNLKAHPTDADWEKDETGAYKGRDTYAGVVYLTWEPVIDAKGYDVYRKDLSKPDTLPVLLTSSPLPFATSSYADIVSADNRLNNWDDTDAARENKYSYTVVAVSATSTSGRSVDVVQNGSSEVTVKPYIPASSTANLAKPVTDLAVTPVGENAVVSWKTPNKNPGVWYRIDYTNYPSLSGTVTKKTELVKDFQAVSFNIPISDRGKIFVDVTAQIGDGAFGYPASAKVSKESAYEVASITISTLSAPTIIRSIDKTKITIQIPKVYGVSAKAKYSLEKAEFFDNNADGLPIGKGWTNVALTDAADKTTAWEKIETVSADKVYYYRYSVDTSTAILASNVTAITNLEAGAYTIDAPRAVRSAADPTKVTVSLPIVYGVSDKAKYSLQRAEYYHTNTSFPAIVDWTSVSLTNAIEDNIGSRTWKVTETVSADKVYYYRYSVDIGTAIFTSTATVITDLEAEEYTIDAPTVVRSAADPTKVTVSLPIVYGVSDKAKYSLQRTEYYHTNTSFPAIVDWTSVSLTNATEDNIGSRTWKVTETVAVDKAYYYRYSVDIGTAIFTSRVSVLLGEYSPTAPDTPTVNVIDLGNATVNPKVKITWRPATDTAQYLVQRREVNDDNIITLTGQQTINPTVQEIVVEDSPTVRKSYQYRIVYLNGANGIASTSSNWADLNTVPFSTTADISVSARTIAATSIRVTASGVTGYTFADGKIMLYTGEKLRLYRAEVVNGNIQDSFVQVGSDAQVNDTSYTFPNDTSRTPNRAYAYKAYVVAADGTVVPGTNASNVVAYGLTIVPTLTVNPGSRNDQGQNDASITVEWDASAGTNPGLYEVERADRQGNSITSYSYSGITATLTENTSDVANQLAGQLRSVVQYRISKYNNKPVNALYASTVDAPFIGRADLTIDLNRVAVYPTITVTIPDNGNNPAYKLYQGETIEVEYRTSSTGTWNPVGTINPWDITNSSRTLTLWYTGYQYRAYVRDSNGGNLGYSNIADW